MGKKGGKEVSTSPNPMPTHWPGKISSEDLFAQFAQQTRAQLAALADSPLVALRICQLGMKSFTEFMIVVPKNTSVMRLQLEIAKCQFDGSVLPSDIVIFSQKVENSVEKIEKRILKRDKAGTTNFMAPLLATSSGNSSNQGCSGGSEIENLIGISKEFICVDETQTLLSYFPHMKTFRLPSGIKECTTPVFLRDLMMEKEPTYISNRTKRYNDTYAEDKIELKAAKHLTRIQDYDHPTFPIYFDVKEYCKIKTYKSNFEQLLKKDARWMMEPTIRNSPRELLYSSSEPDFIHSPLLLYEFGKDIKRRHPMTLSEDSHEEKDKRKSGLSLKTIAFLKNKSKVKKTDVDKLIQSRPTLRKSIQEPVEGLQVPIPARLSVFRNSGIIQARDSILTRLDPPSLAPQEESSLSLASSVSTNGRLAKDNNTYLNEVAE